MSNYSSDAEVIELLWEAIATKRSLQATSEFSQKSDRTRLKQIGEQLQDYIDPINYTTVPVVKIPLEVRRCFVKAVMLLTRYPQIGGKTGGTYRSSIVSTYQPDPIPDFWYKADTTARLCQWFQLSPQYACQIKHLLTQVDRQIARQKQIMQALIAQFNGVSHGLDVLNLFQNLFGNVPLPEASIDCLTTKMQIAFIVDYQQERLRDRVLWQNLSTSKQKSISVFLKRISQFSWQQFACFPSFGYVKASQINSQLVRHLVKVTGYSESEIIKAIATSTTIVSQECAESFLLHDIWGHYWQSILTQFGNDYLYLSEIDRDLNLNSSVKTTEGAICLQQLFELKNDTVNLNESLAKQFFQSTAKKRFDSLSTHLIAEILADINEYKWYAENPHSQKMLLSSSCFAELPTKLDLTIQDLDFLYLESDLGKTEARCDCIRSSFEIEYCSPLFKTLIELPQSRLINELSDKLKIKELTILSSLQKAITKLYRIYVTEYIQQQQSQSNQLILNLLKLQNILNRLYPLSSKNNLPFKDLIIIFVGNYYYEEGDRNISNLNLVLAKYFFSCWLLLKNFQ